MNFEQILFFCSSISRAIINHVKPVPKSFERILIVKLDEIGDMLYTLHCLKTLRQSFPKSEITMYCKSVNVALLDGKGYTNQLVTSYPSGSFDLVIDLRGNWKTLGLAWHRSTKFYLDRGTIRIRNKFRGGQVHEVRTNWDVIEPVLPNGVEFEYPKLELDPTSVQNINFKTELVLKGRNYVVFHCGAREEIRRWPAENFEQLADWISEKYDLAVILVGAPNETELNSKVIANVKNTNTFDFSGKTTLNELAAIIHGSQFFVGNESGPLHFAVVLEKKLVALFGPGVKDVFYPYYPNQKVIHHFKDKNHTSQTMENSTIFDISLAEVQASIEEIMSV